MKPTFSTGVSTPLDGVTCDLTRATGWMYITLAKGQATLQNTLHSGTADVRQRVGQDRGKVSNTAPDRIMEKKKFQFTGAACLW